MKSDKKIILVVPALNEVGKIGKVVTGALEQSIILDVLVVDDGSCDNTAAEARDHGAIVIRHKKNLGAGASIRTGIDYALEYKYDIIIVMGGDDQDNASEIMRLISPITEGYFDFVQGSRYLAGGARVNMPLFRWVTTGLYSFVFKSIIRFPVSDGTNGFRAFRASIFQNKKINLWQSWLNRYELEPYLYYKLIKLKYKITEVPVTKRYPSEKIGYTKMIPFLDWWRILSPLILLKLGIKK
jgi:dolichol-phosphate mannosyltransferase